MSRRGRAVAFLAAGDRSRRRSPRRDRRRLRLERRPRLRRAAPGRRRSARRCRPGRPIGPQAGRGRRSRCAGCRRASSRRARSRRRRKRSGSSPRPRCPAGSYLLAAQLRPPRRDGRGAPGLGGGRRPVEIAVSGADALLAGGRRPRRARRSTWWSPPNRAAPGPGAPTSPRPGCRCSRSGPGPKAPARAAPRPRRSA